MNHTREVIGAAASLQGRLRANRRRGGAGAKASNTRVRESNLSIRAASYNSQMSSYGSISQG
jgi:hypothetical protein